jgi:hypothetical protein
LNDEQLDVYGKRHWALDPQTRSEASNLARNLASEFIDPRFVDFFNVRECEIIASHLYIQQNIPFVSIPLIFDL